jgi:hypothetical protein
MMNLKKVQVISSKVLPSNQNPSHNRVKALLNFKNALHDNKHE